MLKAISKVSVLTIMFVAFIGQAMAFNTAIPCDSGDEHSILSKAEIKAQVNTDSNLDEHDDCCGIECCSLDCSCIANACNSVVYFSASIAILHSEVTSETLNIHQLIQPCSVSNSLYRPPIIT